MLKPDQNPLHSADAKREPHSTLPPEVIAYLQKEQEQRRTEIENLISRIEADQRYGLLITGLVWSWLITNRGTIVVPFDLLAAAVPVLLMIFFTIRWKAFDRWVRTVASYTETVEKLFALPDGIGWERYLKQTTRRKSSIKDPMALATSSFWWLLLLANAALATVFIWSARNLPPTAP